MFSLSHLEPRRRQMLKDRNFCLWWVILVLKWQVSTFQFREVRKGQKKILLHLVKSTHVKEGDVSLAIHSILGNDLTIRRTFYYGVCTDSYCRVWLLSSHGINSVSEMEGHFRMLNWKENNSLCVNYSLIMVTVTTTGTSNMYSVLPCASHCPCINSILIILWLGICYLCSTNEETEAQSN